jgi:hypothetical protein
MFAARGRDLVVAEERRLSPAGLLPAVARIGPVEQMPERFERPIQDFQDEMHVMPAFARVGSEQGEAQSINSSIRDKIKRPTCDNRIRIGALKGGGSNRAP